VTAASDVLYEQVDLRVGGVGLKVAVAGRDGGPAGPVVFLHGFGSTKEDYADVACQLAFTGRPFLAYVALSCPRMFMYGEENSTVSYLADLAADDVELAEIPHSGHWPMYANPVAMWERIAAFIGQG
jgi:pimeloyl-ACP methyl ester carboxylesterase